MLSAEVHRLFQEKPINPTSAIPIQVESHKVQPQRLAETPESSHRGVQVRTNMLLSALPEVMYDKPAKCKEYNNPSPKDPLILLRSPLNHSYCVTTYAQCSTNTVELLLRTLEHFSLIS